MKQLTPNEIYRTAFKSIPQDKWQSQFGYSYPNRDKNEMCPYCKNEDTEVITNEVELQPFKQFYSDKVKKFTVVQCFCCSGIWSFYENN